MAVSVVGVVVTGVVVVAPVVVVVKMRRRNGVYIIKFCQDMLTDNALIGFPSQNLAVS